MKMIWVVPEHLEEKLEKLYAFRKRNDLCGVKAPDGEIFICHRDVGHDGPHRYHSGKLHLWQDGIPGHLLEVYLRLTT